MSTFTMPTIVGSLLLTRNKRNTLQLVPSRLLKIWEDWELRVMILLSLIIQIVLIFLGDQRRHNHRLWIRIVIWLTYLTADCVAIFSLGLIKGNLRYIDNDTGSIDANVELTAFWAPFLLLHLGGPDTITAYSLEDNELWLRHLLNLVIQAGVTFLVFFMAWTGSRLSILTILMTFAGLIKYGERNWVLRSASNDQFRDSNLSPHTDFSNLPINKGDSVSEQYGIHLAYGLANFIKSLFSDVLLRTEDQINIPRYFHQMTPKTAFKVVEIEIGYTYDFLYTKAMLIFSTWGICLRICAFSFTCIVLVCFSLSDLHKYSKTDLSITLLLIGVAVLLETYAVLSLLLSDRAISLFSKRRKYSRISESITCFSPGKNPRCSNSMGQYSFLSYCFKEKHLFCHKLAKLLKIDALLENQLYTTYETVPFDLKEMIFKKLKNLSEEAPKYQTIPHTFRLTYESISKICNRNWIPDKRDEDERIFLWHIVTELCYCMDPPNKTGQVIKEREMSRYISRYIFYLWKMCPGLLPQVKVTNQANFQDATALALEIFKDFQPTLRDATSEEEKNQIKKEACLEFFDWYDISTCYGGQYRKGVYLFQTAYNCVAKLHEKEHEGVNFDVTGPFSEVVHQRKWDNIFGQWITILFAVANQSKGMLHARQLNQGGELLTHVWLLMAQFGLSDRFTKE